MPDSKPDDFFRGSKKNKYEIVDDYDEAAALQNWLGASELSDFMSTAEHSKQESRVFQIEENKYQADQYEFIKDSGES
jgi:hypothetical protein